MSARQGFEISPMQDRVSEAEWNARLDLAACYRLLDLHGMADMGANHASARVPGEEGAFLINAYGMMYEEITASSLVKVDLAANIVLDTGYPVNPAGFTIHSAVHEARTDAKAVLHLHTPDGTAVASLKEGLLPMNQTAHLVLGDLAYHDYEGVAFDHAEKPRLQRDIGDKSSVILRNHGTLTLGESVAIAFTRMYFLERACTMQVRTLSQCTQGRAPYEVDPAVVEKNMMIGKLGAGAAEFLVWPALLRRLDRVSPGYKD